METYHPVALTIRHQLAADLTTALQLRVSPYLCVEYNDANNNFNLQLIDAHDWTLKLIRTFPDTVSLLLFTLDRVNQKQYMHTDSL